jgi:N-acetylglutamate synthase-like GNAT family acetyltransferase
MKIRKASKKDQADIRRLIMMYPEKLMQTHLPAANKFFVAVDNGKIVGCAALDIYSRRLAEVRSLSVDKDFQGRGIASDLIRHCLDLAERKKIYEIITITGSLPLFENFGFHAFQGEKYALIKIL